MLLDDKYMTSYPMATVIFAFLAFTWQNSHLKSMTLTILDQCHRLQHSQSPNLMANINLYTSHTWASLLALTVFEIFIFQSWWPWKCRSWSWCTTFAVAPFDGKYLTSYLMTIVMFAFFQPCQNWDLKSLTLKIRSRSWSMTFTMILFDGKYKPLWKSFPSIFH